MPARLYESPGHFRRACEELGSAGRLVPSGLVHGDCLEVLPTLPDGSVDLVLTRPPAHLAGPAGRPGEAAPLELLRRVVRECSRVLRPGGSLLLQGGATADRDGAGGEEIDFIRPFDLATYALFAGEGLPFRLWDRIIWHAPGGLAFSRRWSSRHETILWYVHAPSGRETPYFVVDAVRERAQEPDRRSGFWGRNPGNVWTAERGGPGGEALPPTAACPEPVAERLVRACSPPEGLVLDPFAGPGTTCRVARALGRRWLGIEASAPLVRAAQQRLEAQQPGELATLASLLLCRRVLAAGPAAPRREGALAEELAVVLAALDPAPSRRRLEAAVAEVFPEGPGGAQRKERKAAAWAALDEALADEADAAAQADALLTGAYRLRLEWNGAQRYRTALELLEGVRARFLGLPDEGRAAEIGALVEEEPQTFARLGAGVVLRSSSRRARIDPRIYERVARAAIARWREELAALGSAAPARAAELRETIALLRRRFEDAHAPLAAQGAALLREDDLFNPVAEAFRRRGSGLYAAACGALWSDGGEAAARQPALALSLVADAIDAALGTTPVAAEPAP